MKTRVSKQGATPRTPIEEWNYQVRKTKQYWLGLPDDDVLSVWRLIQSHVLNDYQGPTIQVPASVRDVWENKILPTITREG